MDFTFNHKSNLIPFLMKITPSLSQHGIEVRWCYFSVNTVNLSWKKDIDCYKDADQSDVYFLCTYQKCETHLPSMKYK